MAIGALVLASCGGGLFARDTSVDGTRTNPAGYRATGISSLEPSKEIDESALLQMPELPVLQGDGKPSEPEVSYLSVGDKVTEPREVVQSGTEELNELTIPELICSYEWDCDRALRIVYGPTSRCLYGESTGHAWVVNSAGYIGLFQIGPWHAGDYGYSAEDLFDPAVNVDIAHRLWLANGGRFRGTWSCSEPYW